MDTLVFALGVFLAVGGALCSAAGIWLVFTQHYDVLGDD